LALAYVPPAGKSFTRNFLNLFAFVDVQNALNLIENNVMFARPMNSVITFLRSNYAGAANR
jgi:hypothetical protein